MKNMKNLTSIVFTLFLLFILTGCTENRLVDNKNISYKDKNQTTDIKQVADKLEVYYFYRTQRCVSCLIIGEYVNKTMVEYYSEEIINGRIDYQEINIDLPENKDLARKFQASGSALFINAIQGEKESINNVLEVWSLKNDENKFKSFLKQEINVLLGK